MRAELDETVFSPEVLRAAADEGYGDIALVDRLPTVPIPCSF